MKRATRRPKHPGYDTPGDETHWGEDFHLLIGGEVIGGTYWCSADGYPDGERWASYGPAGYSMRHRTREEAERVQLAAAGLPDATVTTEAGPAPAPEPQPLADSYEAALTRARKEGVGVCDDAAAMAAFCETTVPLLVGAVSGRLVWEGAMRKGLSALELGRLAGSDVRAVDDLQWV